MGSIIVLDESLINKIAAGEVVERPASIVKELIENSIDAGATRISIEVKDGGQSYISVSDNGHGMTVEDAIICWKRHTTSKIHSQEDLFAISTLGFRGEALASIAAVSEMTLSTRKEDEGIRLLVRGGKLESETIIGCPKGTKVEVRNLFFNTPARKKYLKSAQTELSHITDIVARYALIHPQISFKLLHDNRDIIVAPATSDPLTKVAYVLGSDVAKNLLPLEYDADDIKISGFISKPSLTAGARDDQSIYVNKRYISKNHTISAAITDAYKTLVMVNRFPYVIMNIETDPKNTDVNVHPQKAEIRLQNEKRLHDVVTTAIAKTLKQNDLIPSPGDDTITVLTDFPTEPPEKYYPVEPSQQLLVKEDDTAQATRLPEMRIMGVLARTYILAETRGNLLIIDQHAAAERILYEKFAQQIKENDVKVQKLLEPAIIELSAKHFQAALDGRDYLAGLGYDYEEFGPNTLKVNTSPVLLGKEFDKDLFVDFVSELEGGQPKTLDKFLHDKIARMACRTAIKAGDQITLPQIKDYIEQLSTKQVPYTCPHGRPIIVRMTLYELEKFFKRVV